jgi:CheY-like chemotaxis protein
MALITDWKLPVDSEATTARGEFRSLVTAFAMEWHEREALDSGCDAYISKPISVLGFLNTVGSLLSRFAH